MKYLTTLLLLFSTATYAQTKVNATTFFKSYLTEPRWDTAIIVRAGGYADYSVYIPKAGVYTFSVSILNDLGAPTTINFRLPLGKTNLATVAIPLNPDYQNIVGRVKMATANKSIRLMFDDDVTVSSFTYGMDITPTPTPSPTNYASQQDVTALKLQVSKLKTSIDSINAVLIKNYFQLDPNKFAWLNGDTTHKILTIK